MTRSPFRWSRAHPAADRDDLVSAIQRLRRQAANPRVKRYSFIVASAVLTIGLVIALRQLPPDLGLQHPALLLLSAVVGVPAAILLTVAETRLTARATGVHFSWFSSLRVSVLASAANMLPLPGGPLVRVSALQHAGARLSTSAAVTVLVGVSWLGVAFLFAAFSVMESNASIGTGFAAAGLALTWLSVAGTYRACRSWYATGSLLLAKVGILIVDLYRMKWTLGSLGVLASIQEAAIFGVAGVTGAAASFVPAGLGVTELVAAIVAPVSSIPSSAAFLAVALNRATAILIMLPVALLASKRSVPG